MEQQITTLKEELEGKKNKTLYSVSFGVTNNKIEPVNGTILMPGLSSIFLQGGQAIATILSEDVTLSPKNKLTLPKGSYIFESFVPIRTETYGVGYKVFDGNGTLLVDHTPTASSNNLYSTNFTLEETTDIIVYWYRTNANWKDLTYYSIKAN